MSSLQTANTQKNKKQEEKENEFLNKYMVQKDIPSLLCYGALMCFAEHKNRNAKECIKCYYNICKPLGLKCVFACATEFGKTKDAIYVTAIEEKTEELFVQYFCVGSSPIHSRMQKIIAEVVKQRQKREKEGKLKISILIPHW